MSDMGIQDRYDDISKISGISEEVIRRVYKATAESLAQSLKRGERATLPGICTMIPEIRHRLEEGGESVRYYTKIKCQPSSSMEHKLSNIQGFVTAKVDDLDSEIGLERLNFENPNQKSFESKPIGVRTTQIRALM